MGDPSRFLCSFCKVFTKTTGNRKSEISEGNEQHIRTRYPAALPEEIHRQFSLIQIKAATNNFDPDLIIGRGGFGYVYKGILDDGNLVAVKRLNPASNQGFNEFRTEVQLLCQLRHQHLVSLIGSCNDNNEMILVYELIKNGTLRDHIYASDCDPLPWKQRLEICIGAARGLHYLHTGAKQAIIHRDVKSSNILLDDKWVCKLCDFGLSKMRPRSASKALKKIESGVKGTLGYLDPEYAREGELTEKSDVYSFGVVLFEVLCARKAFDKKLNGNQVNLAFWARQCIGGGTVYSIIDPYLKGRIAVECLNIFVDIACCCISEKGDTRPEMGEVEVMLELALEMQEKAESNMVDLDPHGECKYGEVSFCIPVSDHSLCMDSQSSTLLGSLDISYSSEASCDQVLDGSSLIVEQTSDDLGRCQSSTNISKMDLEPLDSLAELCWESRCTVVEDMKNRMTSDNLACLATSSKNFLEPLTKFLSNAHDLHDIRAQRGGLQLLLTFLSQNRSGIRNLHEDTYSLLSLFLDSEVKKEALDIIEVLSGNTSCRSKIAASGALASIFGILDSNIIDFKEQVIKIMCNLSSSDAFCSNFVSSECLPRLVPFLNDPTLAKHCIIVLRNLCNNNKEARASVAETSGCIASIVELLETGHYKDREQAAAVLLGLCSESVQYCQLVMDEDCIPALLDVAVNGSEKGKASAQELLRLLRDIEQECFESDIATISQDANNCPEGKKSHKRLFGVKSLGFSKLI